MARLGLDDVIHGYLVRAGQAVRTYVIAGWFSPDGAGEHRRDAVLSALDRLDDEGRVRLTPDGWEACEA